MGTLPVEIIKLLSEFAPEFDRRTWAKAKVLLMCALLCIGKRTVTSVLAVMGYSNERGFAKYHHVLNRASWSSKAMSEVLLGSIARGGDIYYRCGGRSRRLPGRSLYYCADGLAHRRFGP